MHTGQIIGVILIFSALVFIYFLPTFIACRRAHRQSDAIFVLNLLAGWTVVGWVVAIVSGAAVAPGASKVSV